MTELAAFFICLAITVVILILIGVLFSSSFFLLFLIFPVIISEAITGERGTFSPNGSGKHTPLFNSLAAFFAIIQVLLLAGIIYGIHRLISGLTPTPTEIITSRTILTPLEIRRMQMINDILWIFSGFFVAMLLINIFRYWEKVKLMTKTVIFFGYVLPLLMYPLAFLFLNSTKNYLTHYPDENHFLGFFIKALAVMYGLYLVAAEIREIYLYFSVLKKHQVQLGIHYWFSIAMGLLYKILFIYFLFSIFISL